MTAALYLGIACVVLLAWTAWPFWDADTLGVPETYVIRPAVALPKLQHARLTDEVAHPGAHASREVAPQREHQPRHTGELPVLFADRYRQHNAAATARATGSWLEETGDLSRYRDAAIAGQCEVHGEREVPVMGQDPRVAEPIAPRVDDLFTTDWFSPERMQVNA
jgi:hypothetical protein